VKTPQQPPAEKKPKQKQQTVLETVTKALTTACTVGQVAACTGPAEQVRHTTSPLPPPVECPESTVKLMRQELGLGIGVDNSASFVLEEDTGRVAVRPGPVTIWSGVQWGKLESETPLTGELFFGEGRVYGRFTQAHLKGGRTLPICMELYDSTRDRKRGVVMRSTPADSVEIFSTVKVRTGFHSE
jgi:serine/threonine-protein kinase